MFNPHSMGSIKCWCTTNGLFKNLRKFFLVQYNCILTFLHNTTFSWDVLQSYTVSLHGSKIRSGGEICQVQTRDRCWLTCTVRCQWATKGLNSDDIPYGQPGFSHTSTKSFLKTLPNLKTIYAIFVIIFRLRCLAWNPSGSRPGYYQ